jgi:hypothetical protein
LGLHPNILGDAIAVYVWQADIENNQVGYEVLLLCQATNGLSTTCATHTINPFTLQTYLDDLAYCERIVNNHHQLVHLLAPIAFAFAKASMYNGLLLIGINGLAEEDCAESASTFWDVH